MARKTKKKRRNPPLSSLDKAVYIFGWILNAVICFSSVFLFILVQDTVAFSNPSVTAYRTGASMLWSFPLFLFVIASTNVFIIGNFSSETPIFGNKRIKYGEHPWAKDCFPLFDKRRKTAYVKPSKKRLYRKWLIIWCAALLFVTSLASFGLFARDCMYKDLSIRSYNTFNRKSGEEYSTEDYSHLTIDTEMGFSTSSRGLIRVLSEPRVTVSLTVEMKDGNKFTFSYGDFVKGSALDEMQKIKDAFDSQAITVRGEYLIDEAIDDMKLSEEESQKLRSLFNVG